MTIFQISLCINFIYWQNFYLEQQIFVTELSLSRTLLKEPGRHTCDSRSRLGYIGEENIRGSKLLPSFGCLC